MCGVMSSPPFLEAMLPKSKIGGAGERSETEGAALRSNAEEGADYRKVVGKGD